jgi:hypothetical protein
MSHRRALAGAQTPTLETNKFFNERRDDDPRRQDGAAAAWFVDNKETRGQLLRADEEKS